MRALNLSRPSLAPPKSGDGGGSLTPMSDIAGDVVSTTVELLGLPGGSLVGRMIAPVLAERQRRISVALRAAEAATNTSREEIEEIISHEPELLSLYIRVLHAAGTSGNDDTLRMLGETLVHALKTPSRASENEIIVAAIDGLTREQLLVLRKCDDAPQSTTEMCEVLEGQLSPELVQVCLISLFTRGLMHNPWGGFGGTVSWELSPLGIALKEAADAAGGAR